ncbi:MAG TPA: rod shape-determining protein MreC [Clostridiaceae bacterium]|nr:rod shape-determining protein MreC [Clostridiaceae bacterium]
MHRSKGPRIIVVIILAIVILAVLMLSTIPDSSPIPLITTPISKVINPIYRGLRSVSDTVTGWFDSLQNSESIRRENEVLKQENARLANELSQKEEAAHQYEELKDALQIKTRYDSYTIKGGHILNDGFTGWFDLYRINLGREDGVAVSPEESYAVVDAGSRLLGRIYSSDINSSKVMPLIHEGFAINAVSGAGTAAISMRVRGDVQLREQGLCLADNISGQAILQVGDELKTSGQGGDFPAGLLIGMVEELRYSNNGDIVSAVIQPAAPEENRSIVFVLIGEEE